MKNQSIELQAFKVGDDVKAIGRLRPRIKMHFVTSPDNNDGVV